MSLLTSAPTIGVNHSSSRFELPSNAKNARAAPMVSAERQRTHSTKVRGPEFLKTSNEARLKSNKSAVSSTHFSTVQCRRRGWDAAVSIELGCEAGTDFPSPRRRVSRPGPFTCAERPELDSGCSGLPGMGVPFNSALRPFPRTVFLTRSSVGLDKALSNEKAPGALGMGAFARCR